jgi:glycosyltransferase involved in cell wall biosynthesis
MILLDSLYINSGGGLRLLEYLVRMLQQKNVEFFLLADSRCTGKFDSVKHIEYMQASIMQRHQFYKKHRNDYSSVLCFGNIPPTVNLTVPVYTYFHNINLLKLEGCISGIRRCLAFLKRVYIHSLSRNTDKWIVQTTNTQEELHSHFKIDKDEILVLPFFELEDSPNIQVCQEKEDYVLIGNYNFGNRGHKELIEAWKILNDKGIHRTLHLTVDRQDAGFKAIEMKYNFEELGIVNHGIVDFKSVVDLYGRSKAIVYPSRNESLGLGLIEAIYYGSDVISADLPYTYSVCTPSEVFDPFSPQSIADAVEKYEEGLSPKSELTISNQIEELVLLMK